MWSPLPRFPRGIPALPHYRADRYRRLTVSVESGPDTASGRSDQRVDVRALDAGGTQHHRHMMTTDVDVRTQAATNHQVRTGHALTPAHSTPQALQVGTGQYTGESHH